MKKITTKIIDWFRCVFTHKLKRTVRTRRDASGKWVYDVVACYECDRIWIMDGGPK